MKKITIQTSTNQYDVTIGEGLRHQVLEYLPKQYSRIFIITDSNVAPLYLHDVINSINGASPVDYAVVPAGEASKSIQIYYDLMSDAIKAGLDRDSLIIALGGGMVGDLAGFVAATFMRGIDFIQMPTTILAHDSSVGGKVAINHDEGKNLIGCFYPPVAVIYDVETLHTLPFKEIRSGYAEIVKHSFIHESSFWSTISQVNLIEAINDTELVNHLLKGIEVKAQIVEQDEYESNIRQFLNFGHTLGHALESEIGYGEITHGEAVAIGMLFAFQVSEKLYEIKLPYEQLINWLKSNQYPLKIQEIATDKLVTRMKRDKKSKSQKITMVLLREVGKPLIEQLDDQTIHLWLGEFLQELKCH
ncbi:3-dehydroquinate synthase [Amphibacillus xylanus]|uniref:3-dehydroquinate synthase n=1 Tax=Amphibacillus xylanus (strain ATCC 51415 / DSM 6626 / JCM 7361 / LMG 17667 / NBRC 15112 / Ep01) TaxID=698758 RepID=K0J427_AMPXN|nr:3-dehydroquinate synthase [Amphibacillus xylanus]BAM47376.1 3-dehydroquinate synthase [Amphibacillus xylanus NBRC 15112]